MQTPEKNSNPGEEKGLSPTTEEIKNYFQNEIISPLEKLIRERKLKEQALELAKNKKSTPRKGKGVTKPEIKPEEVIEPTISEESETAPTIEKADDEIDTSTKLDTSSLPPATQDLVELLGEENVQASMDFVAPLLKEKEEALEKAKQKKEDALNNLEEAHNKKNYAKKKYAQLKTEIENEYEDDVYNIGEEYENKLKNLTNPEEIKTPEISKVDEIAEDWEKIKNSPGFITTKGRKETISEIEELGFTAKFKVLENGKPTFGNTPNSQTMFAYNPGTMQVLPRKEGWNYATDGSGHYFEHYYGQLFNIPEFQVGDKFEDFEFTPATINEDGSIVKGDMKRKINEKLTEDAIETTTVETENESLENKIEKERRILDLQDIPTFMYGDRGESTLFDKQTDRNAETIASYLQIIEDGKDPRDHFGQDQNPYTADKTSDAIIVRKKQLIEKIEKRFGKKPYIGKDKYKEERALLKEGEEDLYDLLNIYLIAEGPRGHSTTTIGIKIPEGVDPSLFMKELAEEVYMIDKKEIGALDFSSGSKKDSSFWQEFDRRQDKLKKITQELFLKYANEQIGATGQGQSVIENSPTNAGNEFLKQISQIGKNQFDGKDFDAIKNKLGTPISKNVPLSLEVGDEFNGNPNLIVHRVTEDKSYNPKIDGSGYSVISGVEEYGEIEESGNFKKPKVLVTIFKDKETADKKLKEEGEIKNNKKETKQTKTKKDVVGKKNELKNNIIQPANNKDFSVTVQKDPTTEKGVSPIMTVEKIIENYQKNLEELEERELAEREKLGLPKQIYPVDKKWVKSLNTLKQSYIEERGKIGEGYRKELGKLTRKNEVGSQNNAIDFVPLTEEQLSTMTPKEIYEYGYKYRQYGVNTPEVTNAIIRELDKKKGGPNKKVEKRGGKNSAKLEGGKVSPRIKALVRLDISELMEVEKLPKNAPNRKSLEKEIAEKYATLRDEVNTKYSKN